MAEKPNVVFVLGAPGAGKGTQCQRIVEKYGYVHLSAGDLLRAERNTPGSQYSELIETHIRNGTIVPIEITCHLLENAMTESSTNKFLIDGFPRNKDNLDGWNCEMNHKVNTLGLLFIDCSEKICIDRCLKRGEAGSGRSDDNIDSLRKRFQTFYNNTMPIVEHFDKMDLVIRVNGEESPDDVFKLISEKFETL